MSTTRYTKQQKAEDQAALDKFGIAYMSANKNIVGELCNNLAVAESAGSNYRAQIEGLRAELNQTAVALEAERVRSLASIVRDRAGKWFK